MTPIEKIQEPHWLNATADDLWFGFRDRHTGAIGVRVIESRIRPREPFDDQVKRVRKEFGLIVCTCLGVQVDDDKRVCLYSPTCEIHGRHRRMGDK